MEHWAALKCMVLKLVADTTWMSHSLIRAVSFAVWGIQELLLSTNLFLKSINWYLLDYSSHKINPGDLCFYNIAVVTYQNLKFSSRYSPKNSWLWWLQKLEVLYRTNNYEPMTYLKTALIVGLSDWILIHTVLSFVQLLPDIGFLLLKEKWMICVQGDLCCSY